MTTREFDIVLFGATGFVGALTAAHLASAAPAGTRIALAGRSLPRLEQVRAELPADARDWDLVTVDATDLEGLRRLAARTTVLASTVGPYAPHGKDVVRAAAEQGTHYADLTGEVLFVRWTMDELDGIARTSGAKIVHSCGFDSVPSDLGVLVTAQQVAADGQGTLADTTLAVTSLRGGISGGTIDSLRQQIMMTHEDPALRHVLADRYAFSPRRSEEPTPHRHIPTGPLARLRRLSLARRDPATGHWTGPFFMAGYNTRLVRLSNTLTGWSYGRGFRYREVSDLGTGPAAPVRATLMGLALGSVAAGLSWRPTRTLLDRLLPSPGQGPSAARRAAGRFRMEITATTSTGARYRTTVAADHDPGYDGTAIMLGQSALCLALDGPRLPDRTGVLTPATALGAVLVDRLRSQGFTFAVERVA
ncbi:Uncharacterized conserved protein [Raineyella antarctica]|uniref:Uncharacterized conserved protein n=1 Tax=Raineyella antarctica TaxID=1577474 RepID=A0A1G6HHB8_9ACTN|nr:saccharopine dehydrogenase NADP-binding domain-containing protein [Raineyella antarctica]SDB93543.1 Uncharacterized conserved protein [Raineyella antarctica]